jgi:nitrogen-specific signal transduction histidine kinase
MDSIPTVDPPDPEADRAFQRRLREMNEALLVSSVRLHELAEQAQKAEALVRKTEQSLTKSLAFADDVIATLREPFLVLDHDLRVKTANRSFYDSFQVSKEETENRLVYDLGNRQWDIPALRKLLDEVLSRNESVHDYEVEHSFPTLGRKTMLLNARPFPPDSKHPELILLAVYDVSAERARAEELADLHRR